MSIDSQLTTSAFASIAAAIAAMEAEPSRKRATAVTRGPEFERIAALPIRDTAAYLPALTDALTAVFKRRDFNDRGEPNRLLDGQAIGLYEIALYDGFIGNITMGAGKTLLSLLACAGKRGLILLPANLVEKTRTEMRKYALNWRIPGNITLKSYESLSRVSHATFLESLAPEIVIADEAQSLKNHGTGVHRRVRRYLQKSKATFVAFSGTLIGERLGTWAHMSSWALHQRSPAPTTWAGQAEWSGALAREPRVEPGALQDFAAYVESRDFRDGYRARIELSPGCYLTRGSGVPNALEFERFETKISDVLAAALAKLADWELPTGETIDDPLSFHRAARQLELGCYYRWTVQPPDEWREARLEWSKTVRQIIRYSRHLDTELAVINTIDRGGVPDAQPILAQWRKLKPAFKPQTECVWVDPSPVREIAARARAGEPAIIWVHHREIGAAFEREGLEYFGAGGRNAQGVYIEEASGKASIVASIDSNHKGRNLQYLFGRSIIAELPREPLILEQLIARTHRPFQPRDTVTIEVNTSTDASKRAWLRVLERSADVQTNSGQAQRLLLGTHVNQLSDAEIRALDEDRSDE